MKKIIYSGFLRTWDYVKHNQFENVVSPGDSLFFYTTEQPELTVPFSWVPLGDQFQEYDQKYRSNMRPETSIINTINQWRNRRDAFEYAQAADKRVFATLIEIKETYVIARTDTNFSGKIDFTIEPNTVYIPEGCDYGGLNDQFAFGDYAAMKYYSLLYDMFDEYWKAGVIFHPETMLAFHLRNTRVIRIPRQVQIFRL